MLCLVGSFDSVQVVDQVLLGNMYVLQWTGCSLSGPVTAKTQICIHSYTHSFFTASSAVFITTVLTQNVH